jgi:pSer/pThr/pTyr-binding forkhead associated (FHA) protein
MNPHRVIVMFSDIDGREEQLVFDEPRQCVVGRASDCDLRLSSDFRHLDVSRHHCMLEIDPPSVRVRDLCSTNGTFVNGELISPSWNYEAAGDGEEAAWVRELHDGDEVQVGDTTLRVHIEAEQAAALPASFPPVP